LFINLAVSLLLFFVGRLGWGWMRWVVFALSLIDSFFVALATLVAGGYSSGLYWLFAGLIVRNAFSVPVAALQIILNLAVCGFYAAMTAAQFSLREGASESDAESVGAAIAGAVSLEDFGLRWVLLLLITACCYGIQVLYDRGRRDEAEKRELMLRTEQLHAAGRLAGEIAHQIKNPLAIINNAAFNLEKAIPRDNERVRAQVGIIREEVARSDRIISELMGYAQLAEGKVERLNVVDVMNAAIQRVFPAALGSGPKVETRFEPRLPVLLAQRQQIEETFVNLLTNARDAAGPNGWVRVSLASIPRRGLQVVVEDNGPGIAPENLNRIFEAYFTTKPQGTGLGLAIARHNAELYGGTLRAESKAGHGARFLLELPLKQPSKSVP
jgi:signal transduction histidine kinase